MLPITFGILRDKERADLGMATAVIEHKAALTIDDVKRELESMKRSAIEVEAEPVSEEEED